MASTVSKARRKSHTGNPKNLVPFVSGEAAREAGRRGGIASGEARRKRVSLREELEALLSVDGGTVAKSIVVAIAREAKTGNVGAFKAIASVLGELQPDTTAIAVNAPQSPITLVLPTKDEIDAIKARREARNAADESRKPI